jgi:hypothetical protein
MHVRRRGIGKRRGPRREIKEEAIDGRHAAKSPAGGWEVCSGEEVGGRCEEARWVGGVEVKR